MLIAIKMKPFLLTLLAEDSFTLVGRYAPSPTGALHLGNLRTALIGWALARQGGGRFVLRFEDLDARSRDPFRALQLADLAALGIDWDGEPLVQSSCLRRYEEALAQLEAADLVYECYCSRRELSQIASAPHTPPGAYPGYCRDLTPAERARKREELSKVGRDPALRLRSNQETLTFTDAVYGLQTGVVDDFVLRRSDGVFSYNFVCVVDDAYQGVTQVCRGRDLLSSVARQNYLHQLLGSTPPSWVHVPLVLNQKGERLAKRDGAVTLAELGERGVNNAEILRLLSSSLGFAPVETASQFCQQFDLSKMCREDWRFLPPR
ncbi:tRNA glutamyl-Q(34) synthetase GluQRS [uncultured Varibaculum sp.]|uniref:tRNA glutamyl-Q(34) synthetase GluQRS n=1 Tax=uncultured Varibaculum sp. TaxID=413896 RepID=UPI00258EFF78|nr:tRNA glutamyl-Q(34) synthetase GluQRS [uncultured Varibaculum sp.]